MHSIQPSHQIISSPALSLERLEIRYNTQNILISPEQKNKFIQELVRINPHIHISQ
ncbi:PH domain-containing protein [Paenibacillus shenyangensis]|uniref:PH domain-containing protein n=1 Tax=Paenibacillus sp. A9 TaxID=1284352 RepID=UPI0009DAFC11